MAIPDAALCYGKLDRYHLVVDPTEDELSEANGLVILVQDKCASAPPDRDRALADILRNRGRVIILSAFGDQVLRAVNHLISLAWREVPRGLLPRLRTRQLPPQWQPVIDYRSPIAWGLTPEDIVRSQGDVEEPRGLEAEDAVPGWQEIVRPGLIAKFERNGSGLILAAIPREPRHRTYARIATQIVANSSHQSQDPVKTHTHARDRRK